MSGERIVLCGLFGGTNLGNEATLASCVAAARVRRPHASIECVGYVAGDGRDQGIRPWPLDPLPVGRWPAVHRIPPGPVRERVFDLLTLASEPVRAARVRRVLEGAALFAVPGTGAIDDFGQTSTDMPLRYQRWCGGARQAGVRVAFLSVGVSRVESAAARERFRGALAAAGHFTVRDGASRENAAAMGFGEPRIVPDLAFGLPREQLVPAAATQWPPRVVALGVMGLSGLERARAEAERLHAEYLARIERLARLLLADGLQVRLIHGDTRADVETVSTLAARLESGGPVSGLTAAPIATYADAIAEIGRCDLIVATRYHNLLFGLLLGRPVMSMGYGDKNDALLADFGFQQYACHVESFDPARLRAQICALAAQPVSPAANVPELLEAFRTRVDEQYDAVFGPAPRPPTRSRGVVE